VVTPIVVANYPIARVLMTEDQRHAHMVELDAKYPGWHFDAVDEYGAIESIRDEVKDYANAPFPTDKVANLIALLEREQRLPVLTEKIEPNGLHRYYDGEQPLGWAQLFHTKDKTFLDIRFVPRVPNFPPPPGAHLLTIDELFERWDPKRDHHAVMQRLIAPMPCDQVPGYSCPGEPEQPPARCVAVRDLPLRLEVRGTGDGHQTLAYVLDAQGESARMTLPPCYDAFTGAAIDSSCGY
jgi:hypothetical protein